MTDQDALLFWLEQEPVETDADIYMPPDTPIQPHIARITYQINKKNELRKQRAIERLKIHHFKRLEELRERFAKNVIASKLPGSEYKEIIEVTPTKVYLEEKLPDILKLLEDITTLNKENEQTMIPTLFEAVEEKKLSEGESERLKMRQEFKIDYENALKEDYLKQQERIETEYNNAISVFKQNKENEQPYTTLDSNINKHLPLYK